MTKMNHYNANRFWKRPKWVITTPFDFENAWNGSFRPLKNLKQHIITKNN